MDYLANRPGVEKVGTHGLFSKEADYGIYISKRSSRKMGYF